VLAAFKQHGVGNIVNSTVQYIKHDLLEANHDHAKKISDAVLKPHTTS
jgi:hypothetical protein